LLLKKLHAERMRQALVNLNPERVKENRKFVMRITGDDKEGKAELDNFINPEERYPVIATTSKLMTTGVDSETCKLIVLDQHINSRKLQSFLVIQLLTVSLLSFMNLNQMNL